ncbi:BREX system serine/threonine kinase PglW [Nocardia camponoti]|uniref:non-specific serine/threonine protein kinase n=1 Tax=Nocardia camponoti TaxID=1616106 RepID=A0A917VDU2_9NOCA|nr:BREX system serine/threonine kinase PglW [Nocardia camponoti]GGK66896.1 protein kinase [Nocardia camponoti]
MDDSRWETVTESSYEHERRGLEAIRAQLPNVDPWFAWSNFTFTAATGHIREVDLLVIAPNGVYMIELKDWVGRAHAEGTDWVQTTPQGRRVHRNPLHLVNQKSKEFASLIAANGVRQFVSSAVCLTNPGLKFDLPAGDRANTHTVKELVARLHAPPTDIRRHIDARLAKKLKKAIEEVGVRRSDADFVVGPYELERKPFDGGPTWQDYRAVHNELREPVRVRVYLRERGADEAARRSVDDAARREASVLRRFRHPGVVQLEHFDSAAHSAGPALIFRYHPKTLHLDDYLRTHAASLDIADRINLVRQLAETLRSAHSARLYHRALAPRSVHVIPQQGTTETEQWRTPRLQISDWQVATQRSGQTPGAMTRHAPTLLSAQHLSTGTDAYLAPEVGASSPDPVAMDVFGLGMLTYFLVTGKAPAHSKAELLARFESGEALRPSAMVDALADEIDFLVEIATEYRPADRLGSIAEFLDVLDQIEDALAPDEPEEDETADPLEADRGDTIGGRWLVRRRLGTGSTSRALLVEDLTTAKLAVLKVALSAERDDVLTREAAVLRNLRRHSGIIGLVDPGEVTLGSRKALVLEYVGDEQPTADGKEVAKKRTETVARELRDNGRLQVGRLENYGDYLFGALDFLEGEGVWHRDLKPDNIAIRVRPNRTRELVLIDFSLAGYPVQNTEAGTDGYLDPFIGVLTRGVYDAHAERYALAVTLHEMASGELPRWGDGSVLPRQLDAKDHPYPQVAADAFDPSIRDALVAFFRKALHREVAQRFPDLKPMRDAWRKIFLDAERTVPSRPSTHPAAPAPTEDSSPDEQRQQFADAATLETHLAQAGLTEQAEQFLYGLDVTTVGQLLAYGRQNLINAPGLGVRVRREIQDRLKSWGARLGQAEPESKPLDPASRKIAKVENKAAEDDAALRALSLDTLAARFVPEPNNNRTNASKVDALIRFLRIPGAGDVAGLDPWPTQKAVAESMNLTSGRVGQLIGQQRALWAKDPAVTILRDQVVDLLASFGRVAAATELADALLAQRGSQLRDRAQRRALALAAVRVVVETERFEPDEARLCTTQKRDAGTHPAVAVALEAGEDEPDAPGGPALAQYAIHLGETADALAKQETLPTAATVLDRLGAVTPPAGAFSLDEHRLVQVAVSTSRNAAATPRLEIYPRDLPLVRAVRLTQAGLVTLNPDTEYEEQPGLRAQTVFDRVLARFPELTIAGSTVDKPTPALTHALREAGFDVEVKTHPRFKERYLPVRSVSSSSLTAFPSRRQTNVNALGATRYSDDPGLSKAARAEELLTGAAIRDGFRVLTTPIAREGISRSGGSKPKANVVAELRDRFNARPISATSLFLEEMRALVVEGEKPTWETLLRADVAPPGSRGALKFSEFSRTAWGRVKAELSANLSGDGPLLMMDTHVFARYDAMHLLAELAEEARRGKGGLWLLCPQSDPARPPHLGTTAVPYQSALNEWIEVPASWISNEHRAAGVSA